MRIQSLDMLRGVAILGILIMNIGYHSNILTGYVHFEERLLSDQIIIFLQSIFADGRFRALFCIMFGVGLAIQMQSCERKGLNHIHYLKSRLRWLFIFGALHAIFVFGGDILMMYSLCGLFMLSRLSLSQEEMLAKGKKYFIIGSTVSLLLALLIVMSTSPESAAHRSTDSHMKLVFFFNEGYIQQVLAQSGVALMFLLMFPLFLLWQFVGLMMIGVYLYRSDFFIRGFTPKDLRTIILLSLLSTSLTVLPQILNHSIDPQVIPLFSSISAVFVALLYAHLIISICQKDNWLTRALSACGRLAFTLYLCQSILMALFFRALLPIVSPDILDQVTLTDLIIVTLLFTAVQMLFAQWYIKRFTNGPFETVWRKLYLQSFSKKTKC